MDLAQHDQPTLQEKTLFCTKGSTLRFLFRLCMKLLTNKKLLTRNPRPRLKLHSLRFRIFFTNTTVSEFYLSTFA